MKKINEILNQLIINSSLIGGIYLLLSKLPLTRNIPLDSKLFLYFYSALLSLKLIWVAFRLRLNTEKIKKYFVDKLMLLEESVNWMAQKIKILLETRWIAWGLIPIVIFLFGLALSALNLLSLDESFTVLSNRNPKIILLDFNEEGLAGGKKIVIETESGENNLGIVSLRFNTFDWVNTDSLIFRIREKGSLGVYYQAVYPTEQLEDGALFPFGFLPIADSGGKTYLIELESVSGELENPISLSKINPNIVLKYKFDKKELLASKTLFLQFVVKKISSQQFNFFTYFLLLIYFLPLFLYLYIIRQRNSLSRELLRSLFSLSVLVYLSLQLLVQIFNLLSRVYFQEIVSKNYFLKSINVILYLAVGLYLASDFYEKKSEF